MEAEVHLLFLETLELEKSQRDFATKSRVARHALPWLIATGPAEVTSLISLVRVPEKSGHFRKRSRIQGLQRLHCCCAACFHTELLEGFLHMLLDGGLRNTQDRCNI